MYIYVEYLGAEIVKVGVIDCNWFLMITEISLQEKVLEATDSLKEKASEAVKVGTEYAEVFSEKAASAAETGNEYLAQGADIVKEYAT